MFICLTDPRPGVSHLVVYGCRAYALDKQHDKLDRTDPRAKIGFLVGYKSRTIFRVWIPEEKRVVSVRDVTFDESRFYDPAVDDPKFQAEVIRIAPALQINITEASDDEAVQEPERPDQSSQEPGQSVQETEVQDRTIEESEAVETQDSLVLLKEPATQLLTPEKTPELISDLIIMS